MTEKAALRLKLLELEAQMTGAQRMESDFALQQKFLALPRLSRVETVLLYWSMDSEIATGPILEELLSQGKTVLLPRCLPGNGLEARLYCPDKLERHRWGMLEPGETCPVMEPELALVPGLCYDKNGYRLGRGGGFYDRWLATTQAYTVGLCRGAMLQDALPREDWDRRVDLVVTEQTAFEC